MDENLIRRALRSGPEPDPPGVLLERAMEIGRARRRRRAATVAASAALVAIAGGAFAATRGDSEEIVSVQPTPVTAAPPSMTPAPTTSLPSTLSATTTSATTVPVSTAPPTVPAGTSAPFVAQPPLAEPLPCDPAPELTVDRVTVSIVGPTPTRADGFLQERFVDFRSTSIELWSPAGLAATIGDTVPDNPEQWYCPTGLVPVGYDGQYLWAAVGGIGGCTACAGAPMRSRLFRVDVSAGWVSEAWTPTSGDQVLGASSAADGSVSVLSGPRYGSAGQLAFMPSSADGWIGERTWTLDGPLVDAHLGAAGADPLARPTVGYVTGGPHGLPTTLHVVVVGEGDEEFAVDLTGVVVDPGIIGVSPDGTGVLVQERWEGLGGVYLIRVDGSPPDYVGSGACWTSTGLVARSTWSFSSESIYDDPGTVEFVDPSDLSVVADLGLDSHGGALACLPGERVALTAYDGLPTDLQAGTQASIKPGSQRTLILSAGESVEVVRDSDLWIVGRNAND